MEQEIDLGSKTFGMNDQESMASWSGDRNPMHMDPVVARRLVTGLPVVHGIHVVLEALSRWSAHTDIGCDSVRAEFTRAISVGDLVRYRARRQASETVLVAHVDDTPHMSLTLSSAGSTSATASLPPGTALEWPPTPQDKLAQSWLGHTCELPALRGGLACADGAARLIGHEGVGLLAQLSTLVGMACPGLHSIFSSFALTRPGSGGTNRFCVQRVDERFKLVRIAVDGAWAGEVRAFVRSPPQAQATMQDVLEQVRPQLPAGHRTWILGGSRGLGELAAKVAAAAGSEVLLTYASGLADAQRVAEEIRSAGLRAARVDQFVAGQTEPRAFCSGHEVPQAVFYFATPRIAGHRRGAFDPARLRDFLAVYCDVPAELAITLDELLRLRDSPLPLRFFTPSSTFVEELPNGMVEYAMAKAASEVLAQDLDKRLRHVRFSTCRLPKLPTDQTNGILSGAGRSALQVVLPALLQVLNPVDAPTPGST